MNEAEFKSKLLELQLSVNAASRADMDVALRPLLEHLRSSFDASTKFAEQAIKSGFILNGGALVLLSGFAAFFKVNPTNVARELVIAVLAFVIGLTASCFTCFFAFRSAKAELNFADHRISVTMLTHLKADEPLMKPHSEAAENWRTQSTRATKWAVGFGICSLLAFLLGTLVGGWTLMAHVGGA
jgi:hypothetical protein